MSENDSVFLTEPKIKIDAFPKDRVENLETLVSGVSQISQSTMLLKKRKEMQEVDDALEFMKEEYANRMEVCEERQAEFERKEQEMREQVARFEKFIKENDSKRMRAEVKEKAEHRAGQLNEAKKHQLLAQYQSDNAAKEQLEIRLACLHKYRSYLELVVDGSEEEYEEIGDILNRYSTLLDANEDLKTQVRTVESEMDVLRNKLRMLKLETQNQVLVQNSEIHTFQQELEQLSLKSMKLDSNREKNAQMTNDRTRESGQIIAAIKNLYARCINSVHGHTTTISNEGLSLNKYMNLVLKAVAERMIDLEHIASSHHHDTPTPETTPNSSIDTFKMERKLRPNSGQQTSRMHSSKVRIR